MDKSINEKKKVVELKNKYGDIIDDIRAIQDKTIDLKYNRFLQRFTYTKIYTPDMCRFIINECEQYAKNNGGWTTTRHDKYPTTDLPVEKIPSIFKLIIESMNTVLDKVTKSYGLHADMIIDIRDLFVVKYSHDAQNSLELHCDGSFISFNILLSNVLEFEGGGTYFDDGLTTRIEQGDLLIHSSQIKHAGLPITKGTRYLLVGFIFGIVLTKSEAVSWYRIYEMFQFQSFHMYGIIGVAVFLGTVTIAVIKRFNIKAFDGSPIVFQDKAISFKRYFFGGLIFGLGWALAGACPGPMFTLAGAGFFPIFIVIVFAVFGTYLYGRLKDKLPH